MAEKKKGTKKAKPAEVVPVVVAPPDVVVVTIDESAPVEMPAGDAFVADVLVDDPRADEVVPSDVSTLDAEDLPAPAEEPAPAEAPASEPPPAPPRRWHDTDSSSTSGDLLITLVRPGVWSARDRHRERGTFSTRERAKAAL